MEPLDINDVEMGKMYVLCHGGSRAMSMNGDVVLICQSEVFLQPSGHSPNYARGAVVLRTGYLLLEHLGAKPYKYMPYNPTEKGS